MLNQRRSAVIGAFATLVLAVAAILTVVPDAKAATGFSSTSKKLNQSMSVTQSKYLTGINACIRYTVVGGITTTFGLYKVPYAPKGYYHIQSSKADFKNPKLVVRATKTCSSGEEVKLDRVTETMVVRHTECKPTGVSFSVGYPWSVGATPTFECTSTKSASNTQTIQARASTYQFLNTDRTITLNYGILPTSGHAKVGTYPGNTKVKRCVVVDVNLTVVRGSTSDNPRLPDAVLCVEQKLPW